MQAAQRRVDQAMTAPKPPPLLPCPFCGEPGERVPGSGKLMPTLEETLAQKPAIRCSNGQCGARYCPGGFVFEEWQNRRASPSTACPHCYNGKRRTTTGDLPCPDCKGTGRLAPSPAPAPGPTIQDHADFLAGRAVVVPAPDKNVSIDAATSANGQKSVHCEHEFAGGHCLNCGTQEPPECCGGRGCSECNGVSIP